MQLIHQIQIKMRINSLKKYPLTLVITSVIWFLSFFNAPETKFDEVPFIDKWVHIVMYGGWGCVLWIEYFRQHKRTQPHQMVFWGIVAPILMSGAIELLQAYCTKTRSGDWLDLTANSCGIILAASIAVPLLNRIIYKKKL